MTISRLPEKAINKPMISCRVTFSFKIMKPQMAVITGETELITAPSMAEVRSKPQNKKPS